MFASEWISVKNVPGTADRTCACKGWLLHWRKFHPQGHQAPVICAAMGCSEKADVGAHVHLHSTGAKLSLSALLFANTGTEFIVPLCASHNGQEGAFTIDGSVRVFANKAETCEKNSAATA